MHWLESLYFGFGNFPSGSVRHSWFERAAALHGMELAWSLGWVWRVLDFGLCYLAFLASGFGVYTHDPQ